MTAFVFNVIFVLVVVLRCLRGARPVEFHAWAPLFLYLKTRKVCAHGERLFSFRIHETIPNTILHKKLQIPQKNGSYIYGKQDLFSIVLALRYLISNEDFKAFKSSLIKLINKVLKQCPHLTRVQLLQEMGFPENWEKMTRYKK